MSFTEWIAEVDKHLLQEIGLSTADITDHLYQDMFEDGLKPSEAVDEILEEEGYYESE